MVCCLITLGCVGGVRADAPSAGIRATRADIARVYMRLDRAYMQIDDLTPERRRTLNRAFDRATAQFFAGDADRAVASLLGLLGEMTRPESRESTVTAAGVLARFSPPLIRVGDRRGLALRLGHAEPSAAAGVRYTLSIRDPAGEEIWSAETDTTATIDLTDLAPRLEPGRHILLAGVGGVTEIVGLLDVVSEDPEVAAQSLRERLDASETPDAELVTAAQIARSRLALLEDPEDVQRALHPAESVRASLGAEVDAIERGENPYRDHTGHLWAALTIRGRQVPFRVYVPARREAPMPLVIALHGAGGDENLFPSAYGDAELVRLAEESGFILAAPSTYLLFGAPHVASGFIDAMSVFGPIDADRVYAIGHSLGGIAASSLARSIPDRLAAACCLAGLAPLPPGPPMCPLLVYSAEFDFIVPDARIRPIAERLIEARDPVEYRLAEDEGHTLMVGPLLRPSVEWLLTHTLATPEPEPIEQGR